MGMKTTGGMIALCMFRMIPMRRMLSVAVGSGRIHGNAKVIDNLLDSGVISEFCHGIAYPCLIVRDFSSGKDESDRHSSHRGTERLVSPRRSNCLGLRPLVRRGGQFDRKRGRARAGFCAASLGTETCGSIVSRPEVGWISTRSLN